MSEESFTAKEQRVIDAARDLAALREASAGVLGSPTGQEARQRMFRLVYKAENILEQTVGALLASEREAP